MKSGDYGAARLSFFFFIRFIPPKATHFMDKSERGENLSAHSSLKCFNAHAVGKPKLALLPCVDFKHTFTHRLRWPRPLTVHRMELLLDRVIIYVHMFSHGNPITLLSYLKNIILLAVVAYLEIDDLPTLIANQSKLYLYNFHAWTKIWPRLLNKNLKHNKIIEKYIIST